MFRTILCCLSAAALLSLTAGCSTVTLVDSWRDPAFSAQRYRKLLVVSVTTKAERRQVTEDVLSAELRRRGIDAVASHTLTPSKGSISKEETRKAVKEANADAILSTRLLWMEKHTEVYPTYSAGCYFPGYYRAYPYPYDFYGYYNCTVPFDSTSVRTVREAMLETNLYDAASDRMVWSATTSSYDSDSPLTTTRDLADTIIAELRREGLI